MFLGKVVLVTGSSQGIGAAVAIQFAKLGANVTITGRNVEKLNYISNVCEEISCKKPLIVVGDIGDENVVKNVLVSTIKHYKKLDVLINNAGVGGTGGIQDANISMEQYNKIFNINLKAVYILSKLAVPYLIATKGNIVNVSGTAGIRPFSKALDYSMSKAALEQFSRCLALELASKRVRVNVVEPGPVYTDFRQNYGFSNKQTDKVYEFFKTNVPTGRVAAAEEIAPAIAFLASEEASYITGASLPIDGGLQLV